LYFSASVDVNFNGANGAAKRSGKFGDRKESYLS